MPTYQYACTACGERVEAVQSFTDAPLTECPACSAPLRKVFSAVGVVFKGSGFYKTDSRAKSTSGAGTTKEATPAAASAASSDSGSGSGSGGSTSNTPATTSSGSSGSTTATPISKSA